MLTAAFRYILLPVVLSWTPALTGSGAPLSFLISPRNRTLASGLVSFFYSETAGAGQESFGRASLGGGRSVDIVLIRLLFVLFVGFTCYRIQPFGLPSNLDAVVGLLIGCAIIIFEWRLRIMSLKRLIGAAIGSILGIIGAYLFALVIGSSMPANPTRSFLQIMVMLIMSYVGLAVGAKKGDLLYLGAAGGVVGGEETGEKRYKDCDTRVTNEGRVRDILEAGFLRRIYLFSAC